MSFNTLNYDSFYNYCIQAFQHNDVLIPKNGWKLELITNIKDGKLSYIATLIDDKDFVKSSIKVLKNTDGSIYDINHDYIRTINRDSDKDLSSLDIDYYDYAEVLLRLICELSVYYPTKYEVIF